MACLIKVAHEPGSPDFSRVDRESLLHPYSKGGIAIRQSAARAIDR